MEMQSFGRCISEALHPQDVRINHKDAKTTQRLLKKLPKLPEDKRLSSEEAAFVLRSWRRRPPY